MTLLIVALQSGSRAVWKWKTLDHRWTVFSRIHRPSTMAKRNEAGLSVSQVERYVECTSRLCCGPLVHSIITIVLNYSISPQGGVGKTTISASFAMGLASRGYRTCIIDFDIGLRNTDIHLGMERRIIFDFVHVLMDECSLHQALLKDKREPNLSLLAASQTRDKDVLTVDGVEKVLAELSKTFDYVVLDSPAGIER